MKRAIFTAQREYGKVEFEVLVTDYDPHYHNYYCISADHKDKFPMMSMGGLMMVSAKWVNPINLKFLEE